MASLLALRHTRPSPVPTGPPHRVVSRNAVPGAPSWRQDRHERTGVFGRTLTLCAPSPFRLARPGLRPAAFSLGEYFCLNDSSSPDRAQGYAILKKYGANGKSVQIESITFGWCDEAKALESIQHTLAGRDDANSFRLQVDDPLLESPDEHGRWVHCA